MHNTFIYNSDIVSKYVRSFTIASFIVLTLSVFLVLPNNSYRATADEADNPVEDGVSFDSYINETETERITVNFAHDPVIAKEELIIVYGELRPYYPDKYLIIEIYTPQGELAKSDKMNDHPISGPGYVSSEGLYSYRYDPMYAINSTETIEGVWTVRLGYGEAEATGEMAVQYQREESTGSQGNQTLEYCNDNVESGIPADSVECDYHNAEPVASLEILGPAADECKDFIQASLGKMQAAEKEKNAKTSYFAHLDKYIDRVYCNDEKSIRDSYGIMYFSARDDPKAFYVNPIGYNPATYENAEQPAKEFLSSAFVHESVHARQYEEGREADECEAHMLQKEMLATLYGYTGRMNELDDKCNGNNECVFNGMGHDCKDKEDSGVTVVEPEDVIIVETLGTIAPQQDMVDNASDDYFTGLNNITIKGIEKGAKTSQAVRVTIDNTLTNYTRSQGFLQIVEIRDVQGLTQFLQLQAIDANNTNVSWIPETAGNYQVRTFMIDNMDNPRLLTPVKMSTFTVFE